MLGRRNLPHDHGRLRTVRPSEKTVSSNQTALSDGLIRKTAPDGKPSLRPRIAEAHTRGQPDMQNPHRRQKTILKPPRRPPHGGKLFFRRPSAHFADKTASLTIPPFQTASRTMNITIVAPFCSLPSEPHFNRFWYLAELLSQSHDVLLITSNFKHYDKSFRRPEDAESASQGRLKVILLEESGYGKNVSLDRVKSHH
ncbi:MAG: hypothetical protein ACFNVM_05375, partial [Neisseria elongata]